MGEAKTVTVAGTDAGKLGEDKEFLSWTEERHGRRAGGHEPAPGLPRRGRGAIRQYVMTLTLPQPYRTGNRLSRRPAGTGGAVGETREVSGRAAILTHRDVIGKRDPR
ncbi:hypothetical protein Jiend_56460 [Micromonospora endophytica]|nr:hypothetical protein Jiend_56460 [Micromonospora endophytica]